MIQQLDTQGPAVVQRLSSQYSDLTCSPQNVQSLIDGLRNGTAVTLTSNDGKTSTFTPAGSHLGYGEAYIALALAAEQLRAAGVTTCATPEQWKSVLLGGPITTTTSSTTFSSKASTPTQFPGVLTLRSQGQGWGQIAQTTNVQLGTIVSQFSSSFDASSRAPSPTGLSSAEMNRGRESTGASGSATGKGASTSSTFQNSGAEQNSTPSDTPTDPSSPTTSDDGETSNAPRSDD